MNVDLTVAAKIEAAITKVLSCPDKDLAESRDELYARLYLHDWDCLSLVQRADNEASKFTPRLGQRLSATDEHRRRRWWAVSKVAAKVRAALTQPKKENPKWKTC
jgi:hypothetical protein